MNKLDFSKYLNIISRDYIVLTIIFFCLSYIGILHHELWLDEAHHWLLARDSTSLSDLITNTRYEGHPILWNILLFYISRFSLNPFWMQLLHIFISSSVVFVFLKNAPFSRLFKILFIFGYFMFFEYNLLSRNYALGVLFLFLSCNMYQYRKENFILFTGLLAIANNTHAIFIVITVCLMFTVFIEYFQKYRFNLSPKIGFGLAIFILGTLLSIIQIIPPSDTSFFDRTEEITLFQKTSKSFLTFFKGVFILPDFRTIHFWNTNLIVNLNKPIAAILGIISLLVPSFIFYKNKNILLYVYLAIAGTTAFFFITQLSAPRYFGMNYLIIISGLWINHYQPFIKNKLNSLIPKVSFEKIRNSILYTILIIQLVSGFFAYSSDLIKPFSNSKQAVLFLKKSNLLNKTIATQACDGTALSSYIRRPIFFINYGKHQSFCIWGNSDVNTSSSKELSIKSLQNLIETQNQSIVFISYAPFFNNNATYEWTNINKKMKYRFLQKFEESVINKGNYYIYEIDVIN
ncbi:hypothetical protein [uncultured Aquimarina sp.]|uniref:hypothetical protein n=1 Tax=uncultured Aquimarina sp. TaxID=575652 RepID=UPI00261ABAB9|nr:hypothetical protein [uncultured Aquimarina sp.]